jgi:hypothetical protein
MTDDCDTPTIVGPNGLPGFFTPGPKVPPALTADQILGYCERVRAELAAAFPDVTAEIAGENRRREAGERYGVSPLAQLYPVWWAVEQIRKSREGKQP